MGRLPSLDKEKRPVIGKELNLLKIKIQKEIEKKKKEFLSGRAQTAEEIDITIPGILPEEGHLHPITKTLNEINDIFVSLGFKIAEGPEIEKEFYNGFLPFSNFLSKIFKKHSYFMTFLISK